MTKDQFIKQCLEDAISALDIKYTTDSTTPVAVDGDFIYPQIAIERIRSVLDADKFFPSKEG